MSDSQQYWLPGYGLSRHIVLGHIQYFLGPSASVRPYTYQVLFPTLFPSPRSELYYLFIIISFHFISLTKKVNNFHMKKLIVAFIEIKPTPPNQYVVFL